MRLNMVRIMALFFLMALLSACSSSGNFTVKQALLEPINKDKSVSVLVKTDKVNVLDEEGKISDDKVEETKNVAATLKERLYARLVSEGVFKSSVFYPNPADYILEVDVNGIRIVSNVARLMVGVMAGPSVIEAEILLKDMNTSKVLTEFKVEGLSAAHPLSSETGYENAVREAANNIVNALKK